MAALQPGPGVRLLGKDDREYKRFPHRALAHSRRSWKPLLGGIQWPARAMTVPARLWLGGVISPSWDRHLIRRLMAIIQACGLPRPLLLAVDGFPAYVKAFLQPFRSPEHKGKVGPPG